MNKRDMNVFAKGMVFALIMVMLVNVGFAITQKKSIEVIFGQMKILLDNKEFSMKTYDGKKLEPFLYEGEIYIPVGSFARSLGLHVEYDTINNNVLLGSSKFDPDNAVVKKWLNEVKVIQGRMPTDSNYKKDNLKAFDNKGIGHKIYLSGFKADRTSFLLNKEYKRFRSSLVWRNGFEDYNRGFIAKIYLDDKLVWTSQIFESGTLQQNIDLDVSLKDKLSIELYSQEKKNGKFDEKKWEIDKTDFRNKVMIFTNPALH